MDRIVASIVKNLYEEDDSQTHDDGAREMLERIIGTLQARLEGRNEGGDIEVMRLVNELEIKARVAGYEEGIKSHIEDGGTMNF